MASNDEKCRIIDRIVSKAPPQQLGEVVKALRVLVNDDALFDAAAFEPCIKYQTDFMYPFTLTATDAGHGQPHRCVMSKYNRVDHDDETDKAIFYVPDLDLVATMHPVTRKVFSGTVERASGNDPRMVKSRKHPLRMALADAVNSFVDDRYCRNSVGTVFLDSGEDGNFNTLVICIHAELTNASAYWTGRWCAEYTVVFGEQEATVRGKNRCDSYYFEAGNIQTHTTHKTEPHSITFVSSEELVNGVMAFVRSSEDAFQRRAEETCRTFGSAALKMLRRRLPVTKQVLDFSAPSQQVVAELLERQKTT